ncbi:DUF6156 family protein [Azohydromonas australica]|uniref:DUF6156 family protein n=1 Tax=Azohydromonas australica TaxID=364039 RepID=UPI0003FA17E6|nr:DUF6156 family protein [Azohydromonas australica]
MDAPSEERTVRCFLTYSGVKLPLQLSQQLDTASLRHRNTYFRAEYDAQGRMCRCDKMVYGEVEMRHDYRYDAGGALCEAVITSVHEDEPQVLAFG